MANGRVGATAAVYASAILGKIFWLSKSLLQYYIHILSIN